MLRRPTPTSLQIEHVRQFHGGAQRSQPLLRFLFFMPTEAEIERPTEDACEDEEGKDHFVISVMVMPYCASTCGQIPPFIRLPKLQFMHSTWKVFGYPFTFSQR